MSGKSIFPGTSAPFDYTADDRAIYEAESKPAVDIDNFTFGAATVGADAEEIEKARTFRDIPLGDHLLTLTGFVKEPKVERKEAFVNGKRQSYSTYSVLAKFCLKDDPGSQISKYFLLPPNDPAGMVAYTEGTKKVDGKVKGWLAQELFHFLGRIGFNVVKGQRLPDAALRLGNWRGRDVWATIEAGDQYFDATTGTHKPGRNQIKSFSFRPASSPPASAIPAVGLGQAVASSAPAIPPGLDSI